MVEKTAITGIVSGPMCIPPFACFTPYNAPGAGWLTGSTQILDKKILLPAVAQSMTATGGFITRFRMVDRVVLPRFRRALPEGSVAGGALWTGDDAPEPFARRLETLGGAAVVDIMSPYLF